MRILIIGGTQFIGPYVVNELLAARHDLTLFHRGQTALESSNEVREIYGDRYHLEDFSSELRNLSPDIVIDMILDTENEANVLMYMFRGIAERVIVASSMDVYRAYGLMLGTEKGLVEPIPLTERSPLRTNLYPYRGKTDHLHNYDKILVEKIVMSDPELPGTVLRIPRVYGPGDLKRRLFHYVKRMQDERPAILLDETLAMWRVSRGYVENVAHAIVTAVSEPRSVGEIFNISETSFSETEWVRSIANVMQFKGDIIEVPRGQLPSGPTQNMVLDSTRLRTELGYSEIVPFKEGIIRTVKWELSNPPAELSPKQFDYDAEDHILAGLGL